MKRIITLLITVIFVLTVSLGNTCVFAVEKGENILFYTESSVPMFNCLAADSQTNESDINNTEFIEKIRFVFSESWDEVSAVLNNEETKEKLTEYDCSVEKNGNEYRLIIYTDGTIDLITACAPICVDRTRSSYNKEFIFDHYESCAPYPARLVLTVNYTFTGQNTAQIINNCYSNSSYVIIKETDHTSTGAYTYGNAYYYDEDSYWVYPDEGYELSHIRVYYTGMRINVASDYGHTFSCNKFTEAVYR